MTPLTYADYRIRALCGDVLLCRASSIEGAIISEVTGSRFTHVAMAGWAAPNALMLAETRQHADARLIALSGEVQAWPGHYDVYRVRPGLRFRADDTWTFMCHAAGSRYGWNHLARVWARRRLGNWIPAIANSDDPIWPRDCSALIHAALRAGNGPQLRAHDCDVVPGDYAVSSQFVYVGTLYWSTDQAEAAAGADALKVAIELNLKAVFGEVQDRTEK